MIMNLTVQNSILADTIKLYTFNECHSYTGFNNLIIFFFQSLDICMFSALKILYYNLYNYKTNKQTNKQINI